MAKATPKQRTTTLEEPAPVRQILRRETRTLSVRLDDEELKIRGKSIGEQMGKRRELEEELAAFKQGMKGRIEGIDAEIAQLGRALETGTEMRQVECEEVINDEVTRAEVFRCDTGELVDFRPLAHEEKQRLLFRRREREMEQAGDGTLVAEEETEA